MKKYTQEEFNRFKTVNSRKVCPIGDYSEIKYFVELCSFSEGCNFGNSCSFGEGCSFGKGCSFGNFCSFGNSCSFGEWCSLSEGCSFGERCSFGEGCSFGKDCNFENTGKGNKILQIKAGSKMRTSTAYDLDTGIFVRSGCFFGALEEFEDKVEKTHGNNVHGKTYRLWIGIIKINFIKG